LRSGSRILNRRVYLSLTARLKRASMHLSFLRRINGVYHFITDGHLVGQLSLAVDTTTNLPNHIMYTLCFCISIGCQVCNKETNETAIVWDENARRYLDDDDWGRNLNVVRVRIKIGLWPMLSQTGGMFSIAYPKCAHSGSLWIAL
jgi:hypothetical protein